MHPCSDTLIGVPVSVQYCTLLTCYWTMQRCSRLLHLEALFVFASLYEYLHNHQKLGTPASHVSTDCLRVEDYPNF